jgi:hypothetical protein
VTKASRSRALLTVAAAGILASLLSCSLFDYSGVVSKKYALVYGVTVYTTAAASGVPPNLSYPDADASAMY